MEEEDEDVVFEGTALYQHLVDSGFESEFEKMPKDSLYHDSENMHEFKDDSEDTTPSVPLNSSRSLIETLKSYIIAATSNHGDGTDGRLSRQLLLFQYELGKLMVESSLLVHEDGQFLENFIVSNLKENMEKSKHLQSTKTRRILTYTTVAATAVSLLSCSYFGIRNNKLLTWDKSHTGVVISILCSGAFLAVSSYVNKEVEDKFSSIIKMVNTMCCFKELLLKAIYFLRGMEMVGKYYRQPVGTGDGGLVFGSLRQSLQNYTLSSINCVRTGTLTLLAECPLLPEYDHKEHYMAGLGLDRFGLGGGGESEAEERLSTGKLRDAANILLVLQSELLRRLALCFCPDLRAAGRGGRVLEDLRTVNGVCDEVNTVLGDNRERLGQALRYSEALGCVNTAQESNVSGRVHVKSSLRNNLQPSLFSGCLHLQNCLLKLRELESNSKLHLEEKELLKVDENLQEILQELKVCQEAVVESSEIVQSVLNPESQISEVKKEDLLNENISDAMKNVTVLTESSDPKHVDEVFEAFINKTDESEDKTIDNEEDFMEEKKKLKENKQTKKVLKELKTVLVDKQIEWKRREELALARVNKVDQIEVAAVEEETSNTTDVKNDICRHELKYNDASSESSSQGDTDDDCDNDGDDVTIDVSSSRSSDAGHQLLNNERLFKRPKRPTSSNTKSKKLFDTNVNNSMNNAVKDKEGRLRTINIQPVGFDNRLAMEAISMRRTMNAATTESEECFGDSSDESDQEKEMH